MTYKYDKINDILSDEMFEDLQPLSNINYYRTNKIITLEGENFKIFKSNGSINPKPLDVLLYHVKDIVNSYKRKIVDILNQD